MLLRYFMYHCAQSFNWSIDLVFISIFYKIPKRINKFTISAKFVIRPKILYFTKIKTITRTIIIITALPTTATKLT